MANAHKPPTKAHADVSTAASVLTVNLEMFVRILFCAYTWVKVFRINPEIRILRLTFYAKVSLKMLN